MKGTLGVIGIMRRLAINQIVFILFWHILVGFVCVCVRAHAIYTVPGIMHFFIHSIICNIVTGSFVCCFCFLHPDYFAI